MEINTIEKNERKYPKVCVGAFIFNEKKELFLMKSPFWENTFTPPAGKVEYGESLIDALRREIKEETNLKIKNIKFLGIKEATTIGGEYAKDDKHLILIDYSADLDGDPNVKLNYEASEYQWMKVSDWLERSDIANFTREVIEKFLKRGEGETQEFKEAYIQALKEKEEAENRFRRALADYQNLMKQSAEDKKSFVKYANENLLTELIPVYDNLKTSLKHINQTSENNSWVEGIKHIIRQFKNVLENFGVEEIKTVGEKFDPNLMEAVKGSGEKIIEEVRPGYKLNGKVIIAARVITEE